MGGCPLPSPPDLDALLHPSHTPHQDPAQAPLAHPHHSKLFRLGEACVRLPVVHGQPPLGAPSGTPGRTGGGSRSCPRSGTAWGSRVTLGSGSSPAPCAVPRARIWAARPSQGMRFSVVTGIAGDSGIPATSGSLGGRRDEEDGGDKGITAAGAPQLGLRVFAREVSSSIIPEGQIHGLGVGGACQEPGTEHSRGQIPDQAASIPGHPTSASPESTHSQPCSAARPPTPQPPASSQKVPRGHPPAPAGTPPAAPGAGQPSAWPL